MKIKYFGTAAAEGIPGIFCDCEICEKTRELKRENIRTRSQALINDDLLIDLPADTYLHVLRDDLKLHKIYDCIITHSHPDHFYPAELNNRVPGMAHLKDDRAFNLYGTNDVIDNLMEKVDANSMNIMLSYNALKLHEVRAFDTFEVNAYRITPLKADHSAKNALIYYVEKDNKRLLYAHDTGYFLPETMDWLEKNKKIIHFVSFDCTFGLKYCREGHMGFDTVCELRDELKNKNIVNDTTICCINHFSHNVGPLYENMKSHAEKYGFYTAYDGMEIEF